MAQYSVISDSLLVCQIRILDTFMRCGDVLFERRRHPNHLAEMLLLNLRNEFFARSALFSSRFGIENSKSNSRLESCNKLTLNRSKKSQTYHCGFRGRSIEALQPPHSS